jgi:hypothetical protein
MVREKLTRCSTLKEAHTLAMGYLHADELLLVIAGNVIACSFGTFANAFHDATDFILGHGVPFS